MDESMMTDSPRCDAHGTVAVPLAGPVLTFTAPRPLIRAAAHGFRAGTDGHNTLPGHLYFDRTETPGAGGYSLTIDDPPGRVQLHCARPDDNPELLADMSVEEFLAVAGWSAGLDEAFHAAGTAADDRFRRGELPRDIRRTLPAELSASLPARGYTAVQVAEIAEAQRRGVFAALDGLGWGDESQYSYEF